jgi:hypothetical protein
MVQLMKLTDLFIKSFYFWRVNLSLRKCVR